MNVGENRARNGVTDCPESRNEENFKDIMFWDYSRYAKVVLGFLRDVRIELGFDSTTPDRRFHPRTSFKRVKNRYALGHQIGHVVKQNQTLCKAHHTIKKIAILNLNTIKKIAILP
ncbi:hypothetical protein E3N88_14351 [Mikania micrantha]|uniref:Uncharacterized protein n=1 Tax=Mikania micrantha TaxID=192012 RepID=A0A5N6P2X2_9ASTR|nr:hypothetical protein E3N88_14351 [Mikania micrantha]